MESLKHGRAFEVDATEILWCAGVPRMLCVKLRDVVTKEAGAFTASTELLRWSSFVITLGFIFLRRDCRVD